MTTDAPDRKGLFSEVERQAMRERAEEIRAQKSTGRGARRRATDEKKLLAAIAAMPDEDRALAEKVHEIIGTVAPELDPRTHYGMPAWARNGEVLCFLQVPSKYQARYATLGFEDPAALDEGPMWPTAYAITRIDAEVEQRLVDLVRRAVS